MAAAITDFQLQYQNSSDDGPGGNGDQGHHLATFLQLGFQLGSALADDAVTAFEYAEAAANKTSVNFGDIALGAANRCRSIELPL